MKALLDGLKALGPARIAALAAVAIGMLGMLALMTLRGGTDQMALLYGDLDTRDAGQMVDLLGRQHVPYRLGAERQPDPGAGRPGAGNAPDAGEGGAARRRLDRLRNLRPRRQLRPHRLPAAESTRPARWRANWRAPSAPSAACARRACIWCCRSANPSRATSRMRRPAVLLTMAGRRAAGPRGRAGDPQPGRRRRARAAAAEHRDVDSRGDLLARAGEPVEPTGPGAVHRGTAPRHGTAHRPRGGGNAGEHASAPARCARRHRCG